MQPPRDPSDPHPGLAVELRDCGGGRLSPSPPPATPAHAATVSCLATSLQFSTSRGFWVRCPFQEQGFQGELSVGRQGREAGLGPLLCRCGKYALFFAGGMTGCWVSGREEGKGGCWASTLHPHSLEDDRPASSLSGPPPGHLLLAQRGPFPGAAVSPKEDVALCLPPRAPGHGPPSSLSEPSGGVSFLGRVANSFPVHNALSQPLEAAPCGGVQGTLLCEPVFPPLPMTHPSPTQGDFMADPAVAFVDIPRDEACVPNTCIQVGGAAPASPHPLLQSQTCFPVINRWGELLPPRLLPGPVSPAASPGRCSGGCSQDAGEAAGCADQNAPRLQGWRTDVHFSAPQQLCDLQCSECPRWVSGPRAGVGGSAHSWASGGQRLDSNLSSEPGPCLPLSG